jgi:hypothetical protein
MQNHPHQAGGRWSRLGATAEAVIQDPVEALLNLEARIAEREELRSTRTKGVGGFMPWPPCPYAVTANWEQALHELLGAPWPCEATDSFWELWSEVMASLQGRGLHLGRGAFGGWGDGEPGMVRGIWCLIHHLRPERVVETGVARGITSRFVLEAFARTGRGQLWSVDLPPPRARELHEQIGIAVPKSLRARWTYVRGSSRRRLPGLLDEVGEIELFIHDSRHTKRNLLFELEHAWRALRPSGVAVADDIDLNCGFHSFTSAHGQSPALICEAEPLEPDIGRQNDRGVFGIVKKAHWSGGSDPAHQ